MFFVHIIYMGNSFGDIQDRKWIFIILYTKIKDSPRNFLVVTKVSPEGNVYQITFLNIYL